MLLQAQSAAGLFAGVYKAWRLGATSRGCVPASRSAVVCPANVQAVKEAGFGPNGLGLHSQANIANVLASTTVPPIHFLGCPTGAAAAAAGKTPHQPPRRARPPVPPLPQPPAGPAPWSGAQVLRHPPRAAAGGAHRATNARASRQRNVAGPRTPIASVAARPLRARARPRTHRRAPGQPAAHHPPVRPLLRGARRAARYARRHRGRAAQRHHCRAAAAARGSVVLSAGAQGRGKQALRTPVQLDAGNDVVAGWAARCACCDARAHQAAARARVGGTPCVNQRACVDGPLIVCAYVCSCVRACTLSLLNHVRPLVHPRTHADRGLLQGRNAQNVRAAPARRDRGFCSASAEDARGECARGACACLCTCPSPSTPTCMHPAPAAGRRPSPPCSATGPRCSRRCRSAWRR